MRIFLAFSQQSAPLCEVLHMWRSMPLTRTCTGCDGAFLVIVVIPLTHHKNSGYTELKVIGVWCSIILLFTAFLVGVLKG